MNDATDQHDMQAAIRHAGVRRQKAIDAADKRTKDLADLARLRVGRGEISAKAFARLAGVRTTTVSRWVNDTSASG